jgi:small subunit ribosomal protein S16
MPTKIRLARHGRKRKPFYHIVIADSRAPRDGKFIERVGSYNPNTNPATIDLDFDKALNWLQKGAQPTDTVRAILSYKGVLYKNHLLNGVKKGAFSEEVAEEKFNDWVEDKASKVQAKTDNLENEKSKALKQKLAAESKIKEERAAALAAKTSELATEAEAEVETEEEVAEEAVEAAVETTEAAVETTETPVEEAPVEAAPEEKVEAPAETPVEAARAEEAPVAEAPAEEKKEEKSE